MDSFDHLDGEVDLQVSKSRNRKYLRSAFREKRARPNNDRPEWMFEGSAPFARTDVDDLLGNINKNWGWEVLPILQEKANAIYERRSKKAGVFGTKNGYLDLSFEFPVTGFYKPVKTRAVDKEIARFLIADPFFSQGRRPRRQRRRALAAEKASCRTITIYKHQLFKPRVDGTFSLDPPRLITNDERIVEFATAKLSAPSGANPSCDPTQANCRKHSPTAYYAPKLASKRAQYLQVDLGSEVTVTHVSVAGRFPQTVLHYCFKTRTYLETIPCTENGHEWFFQAYKLFYRACSGQPWVFLGKFDGPSHNYQEKVELVGFKCRFLRFIPVISSTDQAPEKRGLRIAVYGFPSEHHDTRRTQIMGRSCTAREHDPSTKTFTLRTSDGPNWSPMFQYRCPCCKIQVPYHERARKKREMIKDIKYMLL